MNKTLLLFLLLLTGFANAQDFPTDFTGKWDGKLEWYKTGSKQPQTTRMRLNILPSDSVNQYRWQIIYGEKGEDNRPYLLKAVDTAKGHWMIDELNGIRLDCYWLGNRLAGAFAVSGATIADSYRIENGNLIVEFLSFSTKPLATMKADDSTVVDSYPVRSYQRAVLERKK